MIFGVKIIILTLFSTVLMSVMSVMPATASPSNSRVVIFQLQTGASSMVASEYVSIYNNSDQPTDVTNWCLVYSSASDVTQTQLLCLKPPDNSTRLMLGAYEMATFTTKEFDQSNNYTSDQNFTAALAATSGHLKLQDSNKNTVDLVGWGSATKPELLPANAHSTGMVLQRKYANNHELQDTNNNQQDFAHNILDLSLPHKIVEEQIVIECPPEYPLCLENHPIITEIFPNPAGADAGYEFIEIHNPSAHSINLKNYILQLGPAYTKEYALGEQVIKPGEYLVLTDLQTGISLPNTKGSLRLLSPYQDIVSEVSYDNAVEGMSLAYLESDWSYTHKITPGKENIILKLLPCEEGKQINPDTGKCIKNPLVAAQVSCKPNQTRNPDTGRCRNNTVSSVLAACKPNQTRNPDTGRCRNIATAAIAKTCPAGQERNKETNRCRKIVPLINKAEVKDVDSPMIKNSPKWWIAGVGAIGAAGYAIFEWRREVFGVLLSIKQKYLTTA